jgi:predicted GIY-YIG superfamily endonuclease
MNNIHKVISTKKFDVKKTTTSKIYLIYIEKDGDIVPNTMYVGVTSKTLSVRLNQHISESMAYKTSTKKINFIRIAISTGAAIKIREIMTVPNITKKFRYEVEESFIKHLKLNGVVLVNGEMK